MTQHTITLDYAGEIETPEEWAIKFNCSAEVVSEHGAGGGWPEIKFTGEQADIEALVKEYADGANDDTDETVNMFMGQITPI